MKIRAVTIRQSLIAIQIIGILALGVLLFATTFVGARGAVEDLLETGMRRTTEQTVRELYSFFRPTTRAQAMASEWIESGLLDTSNPEDVHRVALSILGQSEAIQSFVLLDDLGNEHRVDRVDRVDHVGREVGAWKATITRRDEAGGFLQRTLTERSEIANLSSSAEGWVSVDRDPREQDWYIGAIERYGMSRPEAAGNRPSNMYISRAYLRSGRLGVDTAVANESPDGVRNVVAFEQQLGALLDFTRSLSFSERGGVFVLDSSNRLLAIPEGPEFWDGEPLGWRLLTPPELGSPVVSDLVENLVERRQLTDALSFRSGGENWWADIRRAPLTNGDSLTVALMVPGSALLGDRTQTRQWILGSTAVVLLLGVVGSLAAARRFSQPIEQLVRNSNRLRRGDLEAHEPIVTPLVEINSLVAAQEDMRRGLQSLLKLEGDLRVARQIQQSTLPSELPEIPGYELAAWSEPADETGGDTYDVVWAAHEGGRSVVHLLLADASGHGIGPALSVTQIRAMLRMAIRLQTDLPTIARHLNEQLHADLPTNRFITAWLAELDPEAHVLTTASAGQGPLLFYSAAQKRVERFRADSPPFGLFPKVRLKPPRPIELSPGDTYVVLSDGFFEAKDPQGREVGQDTIVEVVQSQARTSAAELLDQLRTVVSSYEREDEAADDRTAVVLRRC